MKVIFWSETTMSSSCCAPAGAPAACLPCASAIWASSPSRKSGLTCAPLTSCSRPWQAKSGSALPSDQTTSSLVGNDAASSRSAARGIIRALSRLTAPTAEPSPVTCIMIAPMPPVFSLSECDAFHSLSFAAHSLASMKKNGRLLSSRAITTPPAVLSCCTIVKTGTQSSRSIRSCGLIGGATCGACAAAAMLPAAAALSGMRWLREESGLLSAGGAAFSGFLLAVGSDLLLAADFLLLAGGATAAGLLSAAGALLVHRRNASPRTNVTSRTRIT
mmetsp:Transcript_69398/g.167867  ORF Transcript_69398/g.167867 Transcript_69398/m.167867 type:complete len:275 (+) Transcript_69398:429-1253(+)